MQMNSALGKRILALARDSDHAHAGEDEAIRLALEPVSRIGSQFLLDVGCGRGGTAHFVQENGCGCVTGFDIEGDRSRRRRPVTRNWNSRAAMCSTSPRRCYDVVYAFNAFYTFRNNLGHCVRFVPWRGPERNWVIFDYVDRGGFAATELSAWEELPIGSRFGSNR